MPLDHIGYYVSPGQLEREVSFLIAALSHMGVRELMRPIPSVVGMGPPNDPYLWVAAAAAAEDENEVKVALHLAVRAGDTAQVDEFHRAALAAGAVDNGKPGVRKEYHSGYYAAFVKSPAGVNLEVVFHDMDASKREEF